MPLRRKGAAAAEQADAERGTQFGRYEFFSMKEGETLLLRFLTEADQWPSALVHMGLPTKPAPEKAKNWPERMSAVCQDDSQFQNEEKVWDEGYGDCDVKRLFAGQVDQYKKPYTKTSLRCWAAAVVREEINDNGRKVVRDAKKADGSIRIVLVNQSWFSFFAQINGIWQAVGSITDRDMWIKLDPKGSNAYSTYRVVPRNPDPDLHPGTEAWKAYEEAMTEQKLDGESLDALVLNQSSQEYYDRFFNKDVINVEEPEENVSGEVAASGGPEVSDQDLERMKKNVQDRIAKGAAAPAAAQ
jgi:hypothetical protein